MGCDSARQASVQPRPPAVIRCSDSDVATAGPSGLPRLTGTLVGPSERSAIFAAAGRDPIVVHEGGRIDAYTVTSIEAGQVRLRGPDGMRILHPTFQSGVDNTTRVSVPSQQLLGQAAVPR